MKLPFLENLVDLRALPASGVFIVDWIKRLQAKDGLCVEGEWIGIQAVDGSYGDPVGPLLWRGNRLWT